MSLNKLNETEKAIVLVSRSAVIVAFLFIVFVGIFISFFFDSRSDRLVKGHSDTANSSDSAVAKEVDAPPKVNRGATGWKGPAESTIPAGKAGEEIRYGKELIVHTAVYLGPKGKVAAISNGMNCQNCHNAAGTKPLGLNFSAVASTYPQRRSRSNQIVSIAGRINSCFQRSLNGIKLDPFSKEMEAMVAYMRWLGQDVAKGERSKNAGVEKLPFLNRAADPSKGKAVFVNVCQRCHGKDGQGQLNAASQEYIYPPLWGEHSYNDGAGLYRLSSFAGFVKNNMPFGVTYDHPLLTNEEAWDVAGFVNSQPRPHMASSKDYPILFQKPFDSPAGPYADKFSEEQHKYGPFEPIVRAKKSIL